LTEKAGFSVKHSLSFEKGAYMELREVVRHRRSIRCFLSEPVADEIIQELIAEALWAPSWGNTQPREILVVTGAAIERFKKENRDALFSGRDPKPDIPFPQVWPNVLKERYKDVGKSMLESLSIGRNDQKGRFQYYGQMFSLFDAPALLVITVDRELSLEYSMLDVGLFLQTFCLLAHSKGLGTCILAASVSYPDIVRKLFSIPNTKNIVIGVALGWPDSNAPVNCFERNRGAIDEFVRWLR
jgi:nitroreductase